MKSVKPIINAKVAQEIIEQELGSTPLEINEVKQGQIATTYFFEIEKNAYYIQFNAENMSVWHQIEVLFYDTLEANMIPSRRVIATGSRDGIHYGISERLSGIPFSELSPEDFFDALPSVMETLHRIASIDVSSFTGYGWLDKSGNGKSESWEDHLGLVREEEPGDFYDRWHVMFNTTFLEKAIFDRYFSEMQKLLPFTSKKREFVHGGYGYTNVLVEHGRVSGVIDWQDARYGDPLLDIAYTVFWRDAATQKKCISAYKNHSTEYRERFDNFDERIRCYKYYIGLDAMRYAAKTENFDFYKSILRILESI